MAETRILLVDDDEIVRTSLTCVLEDSGFVVTPAANVQEALRLISGPETYDVLLSDLHMPGAGDGLTVVSAMRHANPQAVTLLLSAFPEMSTAIRAILLQTDEIVVKPIEVTSLIQTIRRRLANGALRSRKIETVAAILERTLDSTVQEWFERIQTATSLMSVPMSRELRCRHLPMFFGELISRLGSSQPISSKELIPSVAARHGIDRFRQGYTAAMLVEESRMLQVSIFHTLQINLASIDLSVLLIAVMSIADQIDYQLSQAVAGFTGEMLHATAICDS